MKESALLRFLDRYLGALLCFVLSFFRRTRPYSATIDNVLFIEPFEMGASIMAIPSIQYVKQKRPNANIFVLTTVGNRSSWEISGLVDPDKILCLDGKSLFRFISSAVRQVFRMRTIGIDLVCDFEKFSRISTILSTLGRARRVAGFHRYEYEGLYRGSTLIDAPCAFNQNLHISQNFLALTRNGFGSTLDFPNLKNDISVGDLSLTRYTISAERRAELRQTLGLAPSAQLVLLAPDVGGNLQVRNYPVQSYARVAQFLLESDESLHIALIGVRENKRICAELESRIASPRCTNLCGETHSLDQLMELLCISELLIGNDNGPLHFASLTETKILGIFSTDSPFMYGPLGEAVVIYNFFHCSPCISALNHKRSRCKDNQCIKFIPPEYVAGMAQRLLLGELQMRTINGTTPYLFGQRPDYGSAPLVQLRGAPKRKAPKPRAESYEDLMQ